MQLILLASGFGKRMKRYTSSLPKGAVKINNKPIIWYNFDFYRKFKSRIAVVGYKNKILKNILTNEDFRFVENKKFKTTNMVESMFCCSKLVKNDVVICYSDIIFDNKIYTNLLQKKNVIPVNKNWLKLWKNRMTLKKIYNDAEDIKISKNYLVSIGKKIDLKLPKFQFMGIIKLKRSDYFKMKDFYNLKVNNKKIDLTGFLNLIVKNKIANFKITKTQKYWYEIDTINDLKLVKNLIKI